MMTGRASQEAYLAQQRQNARPQYMQVSLPTILVVSAVISGCKYMYILTFILLNNL